MQRSVKIKHEVLLRGVDPWYLFDEKQGDHNRVSRNTINTEMTGDT